MMIEYQRNTTIWTDLPDLAKKSPTGASLRGWGLRAGEGLRYARGVDTNKHIIPLSSFLVNKVVGAACVVFTPASGESCFTQLGGKQPSATKRQNPGP